MKTVIALVSLALGVVLGLGAGLVIRSPEALFDPRALLPEDAPEACLEVVDAADELAAVTQDYLALIGETYVPVLEGVVDDPVERPTASPSVKPRTVDPGTAKRKATGSESSGPQGSGPRATDRETAPPETPETPGTPGTPDTDEEAEAVEASVLDALLSAERRLADLSNRTASATATLNEAGVVCRARARE